MIVNLIWVISLLILLVMLVDEIIEYCREVRKRNE